LSTLLVFLAIAIAGLGAPAGAHGELVGTSPSPGETVGSVVHIDLIFSTNVREWELTVERPDGEPLAGEAVQKAEPYLSFETAPIAEEGQYIVRYSGVDDDGDVLEGAYAFVFEEGAPAPAELPVDLSVLEDDGRSWWLYGLLMVGVVVIAALIGLLAEKVRRLRANPA
jgi:methionine-rich copper-binding protein CopC